jgi:hypothetical protein
MPSEYSPLLRLELIGAGEQSGLWGNTTNKNLGTLLEQAIAGVTTVSLSGGAGDYTLEEKEGTQDEARAAVLKFIGSPSGAKNIIIPTSTKLYVVRNDTVTSQTIIVKTAAQVGGVTILGGEATLVFCDGTNAMAGIATAGVGTLTVSGGGTGAESFTAGFVKSPGGTGDLTSSATVNASTELSGTVPLARGGTGVASFTAGAIVLGNGSSPLAVLTGTAAGQIATWNGSAWTAAAGSAAITSVTGTSPVVATTSGSTVNVSLSPGGGVNQVLTWNGSAWISQAPVTSGGTVTSVAFSTGSTGLTVSGSPVTTSGTISLSGILNVSNGGTGTTSITGIVKGNGSGSFTAASGLDITTAIGLNAVQNAGFATNASQLGGTAASGYVTTSSLSSTLSNYVTNSSLSSTLTGYLTTSGTAFNSSRLNGLDSSYWARKDTANTFSATNTFTAGGSIAMGSSVSSGTGSITSIAYNFNSNTSIFYTVGTNDLQMFIGGNQVFKIASNGDLTINGSTASKVGGANTWTVISDRRLKDNVVPFTKGLAELIQIQPKSFTYNGKGGTVAGEKSISIIADEIQQVLPDTVGAMDVKLNPDDTQMTEIQTFNFSEVGWVMVNAIKELKAEVDSLKAQLAAK